eukprot:6405555-Pyramimonas_sp.AAC.1
MSRGASWSSSADSNANGWPPFPAGMLYTVSDLAPPPTPRNVAFLERGSVFKLFSCKACS